MTGSLRDLCEWAESNGVSRADVVAVFENSSGDYVIVYYGD